MQLIKEFSKKLIVMLIKSRKGEDQTKPSRIEQKGAVGCNKRKLSSKGTSSRLFSVIILYL